VGAKTLAVAVVIFGDTNLRFTTEDIGGFDAADIDRDLIAERLKQDAVSILYLNLITLADPL
jgi:hypothetical protein